MEKVTAILLGAGARGNVYAQYAKECPQEFEIIAVAEPDQARRAAFAAEYHIQSENAVSSWEELLLDRSRFADACLVCTMDDMHTTPAIRALDQGYHVLLEKPMSNHEEECRQIAQAAERSGKVLSVCHVLRYSPFYAKLKDLVDSGAVGKILCMQQTEHVGYWHQAHSFVRGNWGDGDSTSPMILQKSCHDMDIIAWLLGSPCTSVSSFGHLTHFKEENAPLGSTEYCMDGCPHTASCPYYAPRFYLEHPKARSDGFVAGITMDPSRQGILKALEKGPYGRCVYRCNNNVVDHQVVNLEFMNGATASFVMTAFTVDCHRSLNMMGTEGEIVGDMEENEITYQRFTDPVPTKLQIELPKASEGYHHGGGDFLLIRDFVKAVQNDEQAQNKTSAAQSLQSHLMCFVAERSRKEARTIRLCTD